MALLDASVAAGLSVGAHSAGLPVLGHSLQVVEDVVEGRPVLLTDELVEPMVAAVGVELAEVEVVVGRDPAAPSSAL